MGLGEWEVYEWAAIGAGLGSGDWEATELADPPLRGWLCGRGAADPRRAGSTLH